jgi:hypothetical protein
MMLRNQSFSGFLFWGIKDPERSALILRLAVVYGSGNTDDLFSMVDARARGRFFLVGQNVWTACVFRGDSDSDSDFRRTVFRFISDTHSDSIRTVFRVDIGQFSDAVGMVSDMNRNGVRIRPERCPI